MCNWNENGQYPSCIEAKWGGPGCEDHDLCAACLDTMKKQLDNALLQIDQMRDVVDAAVRKAQIQTLETTGDFWQASAALDLAVHEYIKKGVTDKPKDVVTQWDERGAVVEKRNDEGPVCTMCGWNNGPNHGGGSRVMYSMGTVTKCGECLPRTR